MRATSRAFFECSTKMRMQIKPSGRSSINAKSIPPSTDPTTAIKRKRADVPDKVLKFGIPKGSLEDQTLELMRKSGWRVSVGSRSYIPTTDDATLSCPILRPQERPRYIADGSLDAGITGSDWIGAKNVTPHQG